MFQLSRVGAALLISLVTTGCSVVNDKPERNTALAELEFWRQRARSTGIPAEQAQLYSGVKEGVDQYVELKKLEADRRAANWFGGTVDLRAETIPEALRQDARSLFGAPGQSLEDWLLQLLEKLNKAKREESAVLLKQRLDTTKLPTTRLTTNPSSVTGT